LGIPQDLKIKGSKELHIAHFLQASAIRIYDKGNLQTLITFNNIRRHTSIEAALIFLLTHSSELSNAKGDLLLAYSSAITFVLPNASVKSMESSIRASSTHHIYEIIGGKIQSLITLSS
jgi:hypothetical protein